VPTPFAHLNSRPQARHLSDVLFVKPIQTNAVFTENFAWKTFILGKNVFSLDEI
jgi:hypothetical protein